MSNRHRGYVPIEISDVQLQLQFNYNKIAQLEQRLGKPILSMFSDGTFGFHTVQQAFAVGLANPRNDRADVATAMQNLDLAEFDYYVGKLVDAFEACGLIKRATEEEAEDSGAGEAEAPQRGKKPLTSTSSSE